MGGVVAIAFSPIFVRLSELEPTATAVHRVVLALPALALWRAVERQRRPSERTALEPADWRLLVFAGLMFAGDLTFWHWSLRYTSVANAVLLSNFTPFIVTAASFLLFGERFSALFLVGLALAVGGAAILMGESLGLGMETLLGDAFGLVTAFFYTGYLMAIGRLRRSLSPARVMAWSSLATALALVPLTLALGEDLIATTAKGWAVLVGLALISHAAGQGMIAYALAHLPTAFASVTLLLQPAVAIGLAWILLGEGMSPWQGLGVAVIAAGIACARRGSRQDP